jgi:hypothetical protein
MRIVASILGAAAAATLSLAAVIALVGVTIQVSTIANPLIHAFALVAELLLGVIWLLGIVFFATHLGVLIFARPEAPRRDASAHHLR